MLIDMKEYIILTQRKYIMKEYERVVLYLVKEYERKVLFIMKEYEREHYFNPKKIYPVRILTFIT